MADAFVFRALSVPFVLLSAGLLMLVVVVMLVRGDLTIRTAFASAALMTLPWAAGSGLTISLSEPALVELFARIYAGSLVLLGPALMFLALGLSGLLARRRVLIYVSTALAVPSCLVTWTTDLVIDGLWQTPWGIWHPRAGILLPVHQAILFASVTLGLVLAWRALRDHRHRTYRRYFVVLWIPLAFGLSDALLYYEIGVYPFAVVPLLGAVVFTLWSLLHRDLLHARGRGVDWSAVWELALFVFMIPLVAIAAWAASGHGLGGGPLLAILLLVPLYGTVQAITLLVRSYLGRDAGPALDGAAEEALEAFGDLVKEPESAADVGELLADLLGRHSRMTDVALYMVDTPGTWKRVVPGTPVSIEVSTQIESWLHGQRRPVSARDLALRRLGKLREPLVALLDALGAVVLVPLSERGALVGVVAAALPADARGLDHGESQLVRDAARLAARALVYITLFRDAMERIELAKELETAMAAPVAREPGEQRYSYDVCEIIGCHQVARQVGGGWWTSDELEDGRVLVVTADVTGHGVPAALVSATVAGARETVLRMRDAHLDVVELLELLDQAVRTVDIEQRYGMRCFAALFDEHEVRFASAGYPAPWLCRRAGDGRRRDELHPLAASGTPLGASEPRFEAARVALVPNDIVVIYSPGLLDAASPEGERYGAQQFQRFLERRARAAGERLCRAILDDAVAHRGGQALADDITLVTVELGGARARRRPSLVVLSERG